MLPIIHMFLEPNTCFEVLCSLFQFSRFKLIMNIKTTVILVYQNC